jgi:hypothetical protein
MTHKKMMREACRVLDRVKKENPRKYVKLEKSLAKYVKRLREVD